MVNLKKKTRKELKIEDKFNYIREIYGEWRHNISLSRIFPPWKKGGERYAMRADVQSRYA